MNFWRSLKMKKRIMLIALLLMPVLAKAEVDMCYSTSGATEMMCDTSGQQYVNVATGTLNLVNTVTTVTDITTLGTITNDVNIADGGNSITVDGSVTTSETVLTTYEYDFATVAITATAT